MNIIEKNKLIAEFMGYKYYPFDSELKKKDGYNFLGWRIKKRFHEKGCTNGKIGSRRYLGRHHKDLKFHEDWNWLMDVINHIKKNNNPIEIETSLKTSNIEKVWKSVVNYIENK